MLHLKKNIFDQKIHAFFGVCKFLDSGNEESTTTKSGSKKERYFWQYNVQAKGPKGQRLVIKTHAEDPHCLNEVTDPVFSPSCSVRGIKVNESN